jgi:hypothetical protein
MKTNASFFRLFIPLTVFIFLGIMLFLERTGSSYSAQALTYHFLGAKDVPLDANFKADPPQALILIDTKASGWKVPSQWVDDTLDSMRVRYDTFDVNSGKFELDKYQTVVFAFEELNRLNQLPELMQWVENGGRVLFSERPGNYKIIQSIAPNLGIQSVQDHFIDTTGITFVSDLMPGTKGQTLYSPEFITNSSLAVVLQSSAEVHMISADKYKMPLLWTYNYGKGRFVMINGSFNTKGDRGILGAAYSLLQDVFVYPVINSSVFFIDDFPAPIPEGSNPEITEEFNQDINGFYKDVWWPDMRDLGREYGLKYTGVLVETYATQTQPPFNKAVEKDDQRFLGSALFNVGGEIGLHGYNHEPLCLEADGKNQKVGYSTWPSTEAMGSSIQELVNFGNSIFPGYTYTAYVPPANILCPEARQLLPKILPDLKVISSIYVSDSDNVAYSQEFTEDPDGIIDLPRIVSGYGSNFYDKWAMINELSLQYVNSYFVHPDDMLDDSRRADLTWAEMRDDFDQSVKWLIDSAPGLRQMTVTNGAAAVQRFARLKVNTKMGTDSYTIQLGNFYDEAWLLLRSSKKPVTIEGGTITPVTSNLYLVKAADPRIVIGF